jgi:hypothetical protein
MPAAHGGIHFFRIGVTEPLDGGQRFRVRIAAGEHQAAGAAEILAGPQCRRIVEQPSVMIADRGQVQCQLGGEIIRPGKS